jgi:tetratricopeptide (TPR) repeat protein
VELGKWEDAARLQPRTEGVPWAQAITWMAVGLGAARSGNLSRAAEAEQNLTRLREVAQLKSEYWSKQIEVQRREVEAWIAQESGKSKDALAGMRSATELEESMDKDAVTPGAIVPARELVGDLLLELNQPAEARVEFENTLRTTPNRFNTLAGAARAAKFSGDDQSAKRYYAKLLALCDHADGDRPELKEARALLALK